jgi:stage V sporulation protein R
MIATTKVGRVRKPALIIPQAEPIWTSAEWSPELLDRVYAACEKIGVGEMGLDLYPNQLEIITSEQMLDAYASVGMPVFYNHWSFGKHFSAHWDSYKKGIRGLAYELVINSNPCINYLMEENSMTMQALVIAHAAFGHNHFFRNNYLFKQWTDADGIIDYLVFAKDFVAKCEEREGRDEVEAFLDACHALQDYGVDLYRRPPKLSAHKERDRQKAREAHAASRVSELDRIVPKIEEQDEDDYGRPPFPAEPQENLLYFFEKYAPDLKPWQRELIRITRKMAQYFYPQRMTKVGNEGFASW